MPHTPDLHIVRAWRYRNEPDRVHFMLTTHDGSKRHLYVPNDSPIGRVLAASLAALGYTGLASAATDDESDGIGAEPV
jgi:hypothetical protein